MASNLVILTSSSPPGYCPETLVTPPSARDATKTPQPSRFAGLTEIPNSSSPNLPSPAELMRRPANIDPRLKTGSRAAELTLGAESGFQCVSGLVKLRQLSISPGEDGGHCGRHVRFAPAPCPRKDAIDVEDKMTNAIPKKSKSKMVEAKADVQKGKAGKPSAPRKPRERAIRNAAPNDKIAAQKDVDATRLASSGPGNKRRRKLVNTIEIANKLEAATNSLAKVPEASNEAVGKPRKKTGEISTHFDGGTAKNVAGQIAVPNQHGQDIYYVPVSPARERFTGSTVLAPKRRNDWTPVKETIAHADAIDPSLHDTLVSPLGSTSDPTRHSFTALLRNFGCGRGDRSAPESVTSPDITVAPEFGLNKRRKIEVLSLSSLQTFH
jgi:hypothetical protein